WSTAGAIDQFLTVQLTGGERLIDRVQILGFWIDTVPTAIRNFEVLVSMTPNDADFVSVLHGVNQNNTQQQEFVFPGGPVRARYVKLIAHDNYGWPNTSIMTFDVLAAGGYDSVTTFPASNNVALLETPSLLVNCARVIAYRDLGLSIDGANSILNFGGGNGWQTPLNGGFATFELAGGKTYSLSGVRVFGGLKDFEIWVSSTTTDATAFTRVLSGTITG